MINFDYNKYYNQLREVDYSTEQKSSEFLAHFFQAKVFEFNGETDFSQFPKKIQKIFCKIADLKIGQELLTFFTDHPQEKRLTFKIAEEAAFSYEKREISLHLNHLKVWQNKNEDGECYHKSSSKVSFVHELLHYKHFIEDSIKFKRLIFTGNSMVLLNADLHDGEEQRTICGIDCEQKEAGITLCENHFRAAWDLPFRFTHKGISGPKDIIQKAIPVDPNKFAEWFKSYWEKLPEGCYRKEALIVDIAEPTAHQKELISKIESLVKVHNLAKIDPSEILELEARELFDLTTWDLPRIFTHKEISSPKDIIQKAIPVDPNKFAEWFKSYWEKLPTDCYRKEALIVDIAEPTAHQKELISKIESLVKVHNLAKIDPSEISELEMWELFDFKIS